MTDHTIESDAQGSRMLPAKKTSNEQESHRSKVVSHSVQYIPKKQHDAAEYQRPEI